MENKFMKVSKKEAIKILEESESDYVLISAVDFNKNTSEISKRISKCKGSELIGAAKTIIYSCSDSFMSNLDLYNTIQEDIKNLKPEGVIQTILLCNIKSYQEVVS